MTSWKQNCLVGNYVFVFPIIYLFFPIFLNRSSPIFAGDVVLKDLNLKADALNSLKLPVTVKAGFVGTITLKVANVVTYSQLAEF